MNDKLLEVKNLIIHYETESGVTEAVNNISFDLKRGETLGIVGETGAGKTTTALGIMQLLQEPPARIISGEIYFHEEPLLNNSKINMRKIRGNKISMIFQDPMTALNPVMRIGEQIIEVIRLHEKISALEASKKAKNMLNLVGIPEDRFNEYPHQFSGGMKQRVVIAISLACNPELLIADEPTTALDVTIQAQVLELMKNLETELQTSMILISHDLGVVVEICDKVAIMYAGEIIEFGTLEDIFNNTKHPYTVGLFNSIPNLYDDVDRLEPIKGLMPDPTDLPKYCSFYSRCEHRMDICKKKDPSSVDLTSTHKVKCFLYHKENGGN